MSFQNALCFLHINPFFLLKLFRVSGLEKAYLESGLEDKVFTAEYKTRKVGWFCFQKEKEYIMREEETFNQSKGKQIQIE